MLSMHHLSTNTISPKALKELLTEVESKLPNNFELPRSPRKDIWYFYKTLTCITYLEDNEIRMVLKIPLINTREEYEVYKIHNLPLPMHRVLPNQTDILLKYSLEIEILMISKDKAKFSLLSSPLMFAMMIDTGPKFYSVPSPPQCMTLRSRSQT